MRNLIQAIPIAALAIFAATTVTAEQRSYLNLQPDAVGASVGKPMPSTISWTQGLEPSVTRLLEKITTGDSFDAAQFDVVAAGSAEGKPSLSIALENLFMTNVSQSNFGVGASGVFKSIDLSYDPLQKGQSAVTVKYDVGLGKVSGSTARLPTIELGAPTVPAATGGDSRAYLRLSDGIAGDSHALGYQNWIEIDDFAWSIDAGTSFAKGGG